MMKKLIFLISLLAPCVTPGMVEADNYYLGHYAWNAADSIWLAPGEADGTMPLTGKVDLRSNTQCGQPGPKPQGWALFAYASPQSDTNLVFSLGTDLNATLPPVALNWLENNIASGTITATTIKDALYQIVTTLSDPTGITKVHTWSPDDQNQIKFWIHNNLIVSKTIVPFESPEWPTVLASIQYDYARERNWEIAHGEDHYKKILGAWMIQWGVEDHTIFLAKGVPDEGWDFPATTISENFNCVNSAGSLNCQLTWTKTDAAASSWGISTNQAADNQANGQLIYDRAESSLSTQNQTVQSTIVAVKSANASTNRLGLAARYDPASSTFYTVDVGYKSDNVFRVSFTKIVSDVQTGLDTDIVCTDSTPNLILKITVNGSTMQSFTDGTARHNFSDGSITNNLRSGIFSRDTGGAAATQLEDNWSATDFAAAGGATPKPYKQRMMIY